MGYDLIAAASLVFITPFVIVGFIVFWIVNAQDHATIASTWERYARLRKLRFVAPQGEWPNRTAPSIRWESEGAELRITSVGKEANVHTRLVVRPSAAPLGTLTWICEGHGSGRVRQRERPAAFGRRIIDERVERALHALRQRDKVTLAYRRGRVVVDFPGGELNDARLDAAHALGEEIARGLREQLRPPALQPAA